MLLGFKAVEPNVLFQVLDQDVQLWRLNIVGYSILAPFLVPERLVLVPTQKDFTFSTVALMDATKAGVVIQN